MLLIMLLLIGGCSDHSCDHLNKDEIKIDLEKRIRVGDSRDQIEAALKDAKLHFSYDQYNNSYNSFIREEGCPYGKDVIIEVYLDKNGYMSKIETSDSYTAL